MKWKIGKKERKKDRKIERRKRLVGGIYGWVDRCEVILRRWRDEMILRRWMDTQTWGTGE